MNLRLVLTSFASIAAIGGVWAWGYIVGDGRLDALARNLETRVQEQQVELDQLKQENTDLQLQLQAAKGHDAATVHQLEPPEPSEDLLDLPQSVEVTVRSGNTASLFGGRLFISLVATHYTGSPLRHNAHFTVGAPGLETRSFEGVGVGFAVAYAGFAIRLLATDTFDARFAVAPVDAEGSRPPTPR